MDRRCGSVEQPSKKKQPTEISDLGELLPVILSLLPTKESVRTSILSKQWQTVWTAVTVLDFDDQIRGYRLTTKDKSNMKKFSDFVDHVVHNIKHNIKRFRLQGHSRSYSTVKILDWLEAAIVRAVEEVELSFLVHTKAVPWDLMSCKTLTVLKLDGVNLSPLKSYSVDLPNLVKAKLNFWWEKTCPMAKIFSAFCDVENLSISSSLSQCLVYDSLESFPMRFPKLVKLKISFHDYLWNLLVELLLRSPDLEILRISKEPSKLTVNEVMAEETRWKQPPKIPLHLKTLSIRNYEGHEAELDFVQYVMENADTLEKVAISFARSLPRKVENQIRESLLTFTKSEKCQVECENQYA